MQTCIYTITINVMMLICIITNAYRKECVAHGLDVKMRVHILLRILYTDLYICMGLYLFISAVLSFNHNSSGFYLCLNLLYVLKENKHDH